MASAQGDHIEVITSKLSGTQSRLALSLYALKEFAAQSAWLTCSRNGARLWFFCQQHQEFPSGHPSKYYPGPMLLNFSVQMGTGVSNMAQAAQLPFARKEIDNNVVQRAALDKILVNDK